jgi:hypothetical protein
MRVHHVKILASHTSPWICRVIVLSASSTTKDKTDKQLAPAMGENGDKNEKNGFRFPKQKKR